MKTFKILAFTFLVILTLLIGLIALIVFTDAPYPSFDTTYQIGVRDFAWTDSIRYDAATEAARTILIRVWYPTDSTGFSVGRFHPNSGLFSSEISEQYGIPEPVIKRLSNSITKSLKDAPISLVNDAYPVLLFSHGMNGSRVQNTAHMEYLAGNGFVVFGIEHTGTSSGTVLADGAQSGYHRFTGMIRDSFSDTLVVTWSDDQLFVLKMIDSLKATGKVELFTNLNTEQIGLFGHSYGGHTSTYTLARSDRFISGINMDGYYFGTVDKEPFEQSFLEIRAPWPGSETWSDSELLEMGVSRSYMEAIPENWDRRLTSMAVNGAVRVMVLGANHMTFTDFLRVVPFRNIFMPKYDRQYLFTMELTKNWFDHTMNGGILSDFKIPESPDLDIYIENF